MTNGRVFQGSQTALEVFFNLLMLLTIVAVVGGVLYSVVTLIF